MPFTQIDYLTPLATTGKMMRSFVVAGGAGFIGSHFVRFLCSKNSDEVASVTVVDKLTYSGNRSNLSDIDDRRLTFIEADICDSAAMLRIADGHDIVINFAAESHVDRSIHDSSIFWLTNVIGVHTLLEAVQLQRSQHSFKSQPMKFTDRSRLDLGLRLHLCCQTAPTLHLKHPQIFFVGPTTRPTESMFE